MSMYELLILHLIFFYINTHEKGYINYCFIGKRISDHRRARVKYIREHVKKPGLRETRVWVFGCGCGCFSKYFSLRNISKYIFLFFKNYF
jgi:hypothetical protein